MRTILYNDGMVLARYRTPLTYLLYILLFASVAVRGLTDYYENRRELWGVAVVFVAIYGVLLLTETWVARRIKIYHHIYLFVQTGLVFLMLAFSPQLDYFALLFIPLCVQAMLFFSLPTGYRWFAVFMMVVSIGLIMAYGVRDALPFILIYAAAFVFVMAYATVTQNAEVAQQESQRLLVELQEAHEQLQIYAEQVKELAVVEERNRLARELHDSVTQAMYSQTLYAEAASRQLAAGKVEVTAVHLQDLRQTAQQALQEMRLLIFELRPLALEQVGLAEAIRMRLDAVESRAGTEAVLNVEGDAPLPADVEAGLYRIAQESLNNILKHAQAGKVCVSLEMSADKAVLEIVDDGVGFEETAVFDLGGLGLPGMHERAVQLGAKLSITSTPDKGTRVHIEVPL